MKLRAIIIIIAIIAIVFTVYGFTLSEQTFRIGQCKATFSVFEKTVTDAELCPVSGTCQARPEIQQHNAAVDVLLCACDNARNTGYADSEQNRNIEDLARFIVGDLTAQVICDNLPSIVTKQAYE